jgi:hypothetical protein
LLTHLDPSLAERPTTASATASGLARVSLLGVIILMAVGVDALPHRFGS